MIDLSTFKQITVDGVDVKELTLGGITIWKAATYKNWVRYSTESDGTTIYNNGLGYKDGYRVRSGGGEGANGNTTCTGFIPVSAGDVIRISGCNFGYSQNGNALNVSNSSFTNIGKFMILPAHYGIFGSGYASYSYESVVQESNGVWKWIVPPAASGVAYIRISGYGHLNGNPSSRLIVTINEEIT